jgi:hypothetical protein
MLVVAQQTLQQVVDFYIGKRCLQIICGESAVTMRWLMLATKEAGVLKISGFKELGGISRDQ